MSSALCRSVTISAKLSPAERVALENIARVEHLNLSEVQRLLIREGAKQRGIWPDAETSPSLRRSQDATRSEQQAVRASHTVAL